MSSAFCLSARRVGWLDHPKTSSFLSAAARHRRTGVNLERPEAEPRTNEIDACEEWRTLLCEGRRFGSLDVSPCDGNGGRGAVSYLSVAQAVAGQGEDLSGDARAGDQAIPLAFGDLVTPAAQVIGVGATGGLDGGPAQHTRSLLGDPSALRGGVGLSQPRGQPGPRAHR